MCASFNWAWLYARHKKRNMMTIAGITAGMLTKYGGHTIRGVPRLWLSREQQHGDGESSRPPVLHVPSPAGFLAVARAQTCALQVCHFRLMGCNCGQLALHIAWTTGSIGEHLTATTKHALRLQRTRSRAPSGIAHSAATATFPMK